MACDEVGEPSTTEADAASDGGLDGARSDAAASDGSTPSDAAFADADVDAARSLDASYEAAAPTDATTGCTGVGMFTGASCAPAALHCTRKYMCFSSTGHGPFGIEDCECLSGR